MRKLPIQYQAIKAVLIIAFVMTYGVTGYMLVEGWSFADSLYMTVITISTTGFSEIHKLSPEGRMFTISLIVIGLSGMAYASKQFISYLFEDFKHRGKRKMEHTVEGLKDHTIVLGFGRMGRSICEVLKRSNRPFVVIDSDERVIENLKELKYYWIQGDAGDDENLRKAGIERAANVVSVVDNEADVLFSTVAARSMNANIKIFVRADTDSTRRKMLLAGADEVIQPFTVSGHKIAQQILHPEMEDFIELKGTSKESGSRLELIDIKVTENSPLLGKNLRNCGLRRDGLIVVGMRSLSGGFEFAPDADREFRIDDCLIALGTPSSYEKVRGIIQESN